MFQLTTEEAENLRFQIGTSRNKHGGRRYLPYAFTEQGVAMLSGILNSPRAVQVNIEIMRAFVRLRQMLSAHKELDRKLIALEKKYDKQFKVVFDAIRALMAPPEKPRKKIYPVKPISPASAILYFEDRAATLETPHNGIPFNWGGL